MEQLKLHDQLDLLYDMEQPLAAVLAKMEIGDQGRARRHAGGNEVVLERLTQEIYELAGEEFNINSPNNWASFSLKIELLLNTPKDQTGYSTAVDVLERQFPSHRSCLRFLNTAKLLRSSRPYVIGLQIDLEDGKIHTRYVQDLDDRPLVQRGSQPAKHSCPFGARPSHPQGLCPRRGKQCLAEFGLFTNRIARLGPYFGDEHLIDAF